MHASLAVSNNLPTWSIFTVRSRRGGGSGDHWEREEHERRHDDVSFLLTDGFANFTPGRGRNILVPARVLTRDAVMPTTRRRSRRSRSCGGSSRSHSRDRDCKQPEAFPRSLGDLINAPHEEAVKFARHSKRENRVYVGDLIYDVKYRELIEFMRGGGWGRFSGLPSFFYFVVVVHRVVVLIWKLAPGGKRELESEPETGVKAGRWQARTPTIRMPPGGTGYGHGRSSRRSCSSFFRFFTGHSELCS